MGNRQDKASPRHGIPRDSAKEYAAKDHFKTRAMRRPKQVWDKEQKVWMHLEKV